MKPTPEMIEAAKEQMELAGFYSPPTAAWERALTAALALLPGDPAPEMAAERERLPYGLRLQIGKALDRLVCEESTPAQVDQFIATFHEFGLNISAANSEGSGPVISDTDRLKIPRMTAAWGGIANAPEALDEAALKAAKEAMVEATGLSPMWGSSAAWAGARAAVTAYLATTSGDRP